MATGDSRWGGGGRGGRKVGSCSGNKGGAQGAETLTSPRSYKYCYTRARLGNLLHASIRPDEQLHRDTTHTAQPQHSLGITKTRGERWTHREGHTWTTKYKNVDTDQPGRSVDRVGRSEIRSVGDSVSGNRSVGRSVGRSVSRSVGYSVTRLPRTA